MGTETGKIKTKEDLFETICNASNLDTLGFFVGAGFSKELISDDHWKKAYSWEELIIECRKRMNLTNEDDKKESEELQKLKENTSYPEQSSKLCREYAKKNKVSYDEAVGKIKSIIAEVLNSDPNENKKNRYKNWFNRLSPNWIVTTNYDFILESVIGGGALTIPPDGCFCKIKGMIPVFHIHGTCKDPDGIIITNEDYTRMFRPSDYRQARLPFLIKESCVLMIGYGLGDINVVTAVDWSKNVYTNINSQYNFPIIQLLLNKENPDPDPYENDGVIIYEIKNLESFFKELISYYENHQKNYELKISKIQKTTQEFINAEESDIDKFISDREYRKKILQFMQDLQPEFGYVYNTFHYYLIMALAVVDARSSEVGAFEWYEEKLKLILDVFSYISLDKIPPSVFSALSNALNSVAYYIDLKGKHPKGKAHEATDYWFKNKGSISKDVVEELERSCRTNKALVGLSHLLKTI